jgi:predicted dehydrogenase
VALCAEQVEDLQRLALQRGLTVAVDFEYRAVPLFQQLAAVVASGSRPTWSASSPACARA